jgi:hypothetical protein
VLWATSKTHVNLKYSQGFAVNNVNEPFVKNATATAIDVPPGFNKWKSDLTKEKCVCVHICDAIYVLTIKCSGADKSFPCQGKCF